MSHSSGDAHGSVPLQWWCSRLCPTPVMMFIAIYVPLQWWCSWCCPTPVMMFMALSHSSDADGSVPLQQKGSSHWGGYKYKKIPKKLRNKSVKLSSRDCLSVLCINIFLWAEILFCHILTHWLSWDERIGEGGVLECDKDFGFMR